MLLPPSASRLHLGREVPLQEIPGRISKAVNSQRRLVKSELATERMPAGPTHKEAGTLIPPRLFTGQLGHQFGHLVGIHHGVFDVHMVEEAFDKQGDKSGIGKKRSSLPGCGSVVVSSVVYATVLRRENRCIEHARGQIVVERRPGQYSVRSNARRHLRVPGYGDVPSTGHVMHRILLVVFPCRQMSCAHR